MLEVNLDPFQLSYTGCFYRTRGRPIIGYADLTNPLTNPCLVTLIDVTLACEDAHSKLVEVVTVADVCDEDRVGHSLLQIWKQGFGHKS